jgi:import receptor subunit TOM70
MDSNNIPPTPSVHPIPPNVVASSPSLWSRISTYASENKVAVFTIGAIVVVAGAGGVYYISQSRTNESTTPKEKKGKKDKRKKEKEQKEDTTEKTKPKGTQTRTLLSSDIRAMLISWATQWTWFPMKAMLYRMLMKLQFNC